MPIIDSILNFPDLYLCLCTVYCMLLATLFILIIIIIVPQARLRACQFALIQKSVTGKKNCYYMLSTIYSIYTF